MCGICGKLNLDREAPVTIGDLQRMTASITHRGPDDEGFYIDGEVGFGFRRLSIIDVKAGHQPLANEDESVWVVFNGEIYNFQELREELQAKGHVFRTRTDTEVLVHLYEEHGPGLVNRLRGMFAFAIWDGIKKSLLLARDRLGIKPLYYSVTQKFVSFGSEIKAILADPAFSREIDPSMIDRFLSFYYMPGEESLFKDVFKLAPATYLIVENGTIKTTQYWDVHFGPVDPELDLARAEEKLLDILQQTTCSHMVSDVPVGFLLSGGVDSTALLSFAAGTTPQRISSFTVGFDAPGVVDERPYARLAAKQFQTTHYEMAISPEQFSDFLPKYVWHMEEPVCEPPAIALYYVSQLAREHVKVLISGEGGDEILAGYSNYRNLLWLERFKRTVGPGRRIASQGLRVANRLFGSGKVSRYVDLMDAPFEDYYYSRTSTPFHYFNRHTGELYSKALFDRVDKVRSLGAVFRHSGKQGADMLHTMLYLDMKTWLPDELLVKADKMTMANSVELRVPFLDHKVVEFAASLPASMKVRGRNTKFLAKRALAKRVPRQILNRPKAGFPVPYESWLRKELSGWVGDLLFQKRTVERGYFEPKTVQSLFCENLKTGRYSKEIFCLVVLELWHRVFLDGFDAVAPVQESSLSR